MSPDLVAAFPILLLVASIAFALYCLNELAHAEVVLFLPRELWTIIICLSTPLGGIAYLMLGRPR
jgi:hypothetical protein